MSLFRCCLLRRSFHLIFINFQYVCYKLRTWHESIPLLSPAQIIPSNISESSYLVPILQYSVVMSDTFAACIWFGSTCSPCTQHMTWFVSGSKQPYLLNVKIVLMKSIFLRNYRAYQILRTASDGVRSRPWLASRPTSAALHWRCSQTLTLIFQFNFRADGHAHRRIFAKGTR